MRHWPRHVQNQSQAHSHSKAKICSHLRLINWTAGFASRFAKPSIDAFTVKHVPAITDRLGIQVLQHVSCCQYSW